MPPIERFLLLWLDGQRVIDARSVMDVRRTIEDDVRLPPEAVEVDLWLESPGGDAHAAYKLALMLRAVAGRIRVVVPDYAKSAATLLALVGDEIYMAPGAELGPLDAQMPEEGSLLGRISALNIARAADDVAREAVMMALEGGAELLSITGLSRAQTIEAMLKFSAEFSEPLVRQLDPRVVHDAKQTLRVTARYAERLLKKTSCPQPDQTAKKMVENFPTHGFVIDREEAQELGLPVKPIEAYEHLDKARLIHRAAEEGTRCIRFVNMDGFLSAASREMGEEDEGGDPDDEQSRQPNTARAARRSRNGAKAKPTSRARSAS